MKLVTALALLLTFVSPASAETPLISICKRAISHWLFSEKISVIAAHDFSNLKPPRVRIKIDDALSSNYSCAFRSAERPTGLIEFCNGFGCYKAGHQMFDEVAELLKREGF